MERYIVEAKKQSGIVRYAPLLIRDAIYIATGHTITQRLVYDEDDDTVWFGTFEEAERICGRHASINEQFSDVKSARWDYRTGEWVDVKMANASHCRPSGREDFHADL